MQEIYKITKISAEDLVLDTGTIIDLDIKTDKICIIRGLKDLTIFPIKSISQERINFNKTTHLG